MSLLWIIQEPLPDEDLTKMFKIPMAPSRLNPLILSGTISHTADEVRLQFSLETSDCVSFSGFRVLLSVCSETVLDRTTAGKLVLISYSGHIIPMLFRMQK